MNLEFEKLNVYDASEDNLEAGKLIIEPLESGFGHTIGNALRRTLYRSMPGASVIGFEIPGIYHEFTNIEGSITDTTQLIFNLKKIKFSVDLENEELIKLSFRKNKKGEYTASDIDLPSQVELKNPDQPLITLTGDKEVEMTLYVRVGKGYKDAQEHTEFKDMPTVIKVDGMFSPIEKVGYRVEKTRLGQDASYERVILDVRTDNTMEPKEVVSIAGMILSKFFSAFKEISHISEKVEMHKEKEVEEDLTLDQSIDELDLSVRSFNCLKREGRTKVRDIIELSEKQLAAINQLGKTSVEEIKEKMKELGLEFRKD